MEIFQSIDLNIVGLGLIFYSPFAVADIPEGADYLASDFENPKQVEQQAIEGRIVGVSTGSPGAYSLNFARGYPTDEMLQRSKYRLRLGIQIRGGALHVRDLFDLMDWSVVCPECQTVLLSDGIYHITLLSDDPPSGILGDHQKIYVYLQLLDEFPQLRYIGVPTLC